MLLSDDTFYQYFPYYDSLSVLARKVNVVYIWYVGDLVNQTPVSSLI